MDELDPKFLLVSLVLSLVVTWTIGLVPPIAIRYVWAKRPLRKWEAIGTCSMFWFMNLAAFAALGATKPPTYGVSLIAFASYWLLRGEPSAKNKSIETPLKVTQAVEDQMSRLDGLRAEGALTESEYQASRAAFLAAPNVD